MYSVMGADIDNDLISHMLLRAIVFSGLRIMYV